jgi:hypothetical protein
MALGGHDKGHALLVQRATELVEPFIASLPEQVLDLLLSISRDRDFIRALAIAALVRKADAADAKRRRKRRTKRGGACSS